jgi:hypothetical protein
MATDKEASTVRCERVSEALQALRKVHLAWFLESLNCASLSKFSH